MPYSPTNGVLGLCSQKMTDPCDVRARSRTVVSVTIGITMPCDSWTQTKSTNGE